MTERIAILGGEPYEEWIKFDGPAQRMYKAYCDKWPDGNAACFVLRGAMLHDALLGIAQYGRLIDSDFPSRVSRRSSWPVSG